MSELLIAATPTEADWERAEQFHGHIGPWLALGMRIGSDAVCELSLSSHFAVQVDVNCPLRTPFSCLLDGLQLSTGATYGKRNITATESSPDAIKVVVTNKQTGRSLDFEVKPQACTLISEWFATHGGEEAARQVWSASRDSLLSSAQADGGE